MTSDKARMHRAKSEHNLAAYALLRSISDEYRDWEVVFLYYAALHRVQEHAVLRGGKLPTSHWERLEYVRLNIREIYPDFYYLHSRSMKARYLAGVETTAKIRDLADARCKRVMAAIP